MEKEKEITQNSLGYIISGPKGGGKTTFCQKLVEQLGEKKIPAHGIITLGQDDREFLDLSTNKKLSWKPKENEKSLEIGQFVISLSIFQWACSMIDNLEDYPGRFCIVVDEIGHLEARGEGFFPSVNKLFTSRSDVIPVLVIRSGLVQYFTDIFKAFDWKVIEVTEENRSKVYNQLSQIIEEIGCLLQ